MGALSFADDVTLLRPSLGGRSEMLHICSMLAGIFDIIINNENQLNKMVK